MTYPFLSHHGGTRGVTGSCHQLHLDSAHSLLVDCGLEQGAGVGGGAASAVIDFDVAGIQALVVTHVHLDHVGRIPALFAAGFHGPIYCSEPSARLLPLVLEDAYRLAISSDPVEVARYLAFVQQRIVALPFDRWQVLIEDSALRCAIRLRCAGHLLGSAYVECDVACPDGGARVVFSGDLGAPDNPLLRPVEPPERADVLVLESTYGGRIHLGRSDRRRQLEQAIDRALVDHGTILIPAFSLGRTQDLLCEIEEILHGKALLNEPAVKVQGDFPEWSRLPIILDSPLAKRVIDVYRELHQYWRQAARDRVSQGRDPLSFRQLISIDTHARHQQVVNYLKSTGRPAIVIAGNGMCSGGRIVNYLKAMLVDPRHEVLFVGYQAKGTPGAVIQASEGAEGFVQIDLDGRMYDIRAKVMTVSGYSGHADQEGLIRFALCQEEPAKRVVLVHGDQASKQALALALRRRSHDLGCAMDVTVAQ